ncbi:MAG: TIGR02099 family protein [Gammaproteobacteria bacterium]|nr:TIGR02099 family protein [Gammaproteobacteria bacterium]MCW5583514.1 TIGR02099 family protein [Gammaproteobacteria bacterium]
MRKPRGSVVKAFLKSLIRKAAYVFAALIIVAAVIVCVAQFLTPILDKHRTDFEKLASQLLQMPVAIKNVQLSWYQYQPVISLNQVTIRDKASQQPTLQVKKINILFSIPQSLWQWKVVTNGMMVSGTALNVNQAATGELTLQGFPALSFNQQPHSSETGWMDAAAWISQEPHLILRDIDVHYTGPDGQKKFVTLHELNFKNTKTRHYILGKAILHQTLPTEIAVAIQWNGTGVDLSQIKAHVYLYVTGFSISQWAKGYVWKGWQADEGIVSAKIWADWGHGAFQQIQSSFQSYGLVLRSQTDKSIHQVNRFSGNVGWKRHGNHQVFAGDDVLIDLPAHLWPMTNFYISLVSDANGVLTPKAANVGYVDLDDVQQFMLSSSELLPASLLQTATELKLAGALQNVAVVFLGAWNDINHISFNANFTRLSVSPWRKYPGVANLTGMVKWNGAEGDLKLTSTHVVLQYDAIFMHEIAIDQLSGEMEWQRDQNHRWLLRLSSMQMLNNDAVVNAKGAITISPDKPLVTDISANFILRKAAHVARYLPIKIFDADLAKWLQEAFLSGEVQAGQAVLRGALADFPFDKNHGLFSITGKVNNVDFRFAPDWPILQHVTGTLAFTGRKITVDVDHAETLGITATKVHGVIPYLGDDKPQILQVETGDIQTNFVQGLKYVHSSPLEKSIGKMFADMKMNGPIKLKLGLMIPLKDPDNTQVQGSLDIQNGQIHLVPWDLKLNKLNGQIKFTETTAEAKNIRAWLFNKPFQFDLTTQQKTKDVSVIQASFTSSLNIKDIENWLKLPLSQMAQGSTMVKGAIDFSLNAPIEIRLSSNLMGVAINLADQYGKNAQEARDFSADIIAQENQPLRVKVSYGNLLSTAIVFSRKKEKYSLISTNLRFGRGKIDWPKTAGIYITGEFDKLDWDKIKTYMGRSSNTYLSDVALKEVDVRVNYLNLGGQQLTRVRLQVVPIQNDWNVNINSPEIVGQFIVPQNLNRQRMITAQIQKIHMHSDLNAKQSSMMFDVKTLPAINLVANNVQYNDIPLGQITFEATPSANGLTIQTLRILSSRIDLRTSGNWTQSGNNHITHLKGSATSAHVSSLLNSFGMDVHNFVSSNGSLNFDVTWNGGPYAPSISNMNGKALLVLGPGRIVDIGRDSAKMDLGRMLSIFSLQTIPRRLTLDFSDVFQKGYSFDSVRGDVIIRNGDILTKNLYFDGPVARIGINGRIGLKNKDYDLILGVTAHVTSSIPVAATLLTGNPLIGLGAFAVNTMLGSSMPGAATNYYAVRGPWNNPTWKSVKLSR